jgi:hypothetical protein
MTRDMGHDALEALAAVRVVFPEAIIAGGFLRDVYFHRTPKDIDIFVPYTLGAATKMLDRFNIPVMVGSAYMPGSDVGVIWNIPGYTLPVQVIMMDHGVDIVERVKKHDFDFCQIWHDGFCTYSTDAFKAMNMNTVTLVDCEDHLQFKRSMRRWDRLKQKYPDYQLVIPKRFQHFTQTEASQVEASSFQEDPFA